MKKCEVKQCPLASPTSTLFKSCLAGSFAVLTATVQAQTNSTALGKDANPTPLDAGVSLRQPAVDEVNGKLGYAGGNMNSAEGHNFDGSIALPISHPFGFQVDALYSRISGEDFYGGAGHLFWRDPDIGLIGVTGGYLARQGVDTYQAGAESEYYLDRFTFGFFAGVGSISYANVVPFIATHPTRFVGRVSVDWYAVDDLRLGASYTTAFDDNLVKGEAEYQTAVRGLALTAEVAAGDHGYDHWLLGVRYYFGRKKSLRDRHRQDDPRSLMPQLLHGLGAYGAEFDAKGKAYFITHLEAGTWTGGDTYGSIRIITRGSGSNGVGDGTGPQPPGGPPTNDGPGTSPGHPGQH